ncbi:MAG: RNA polymerase sigma factor [Verrucomicrobiae bacterium]|nr:RNA polymerase sigma factor [Verrucomicrobiae bacterium]
MEKEGFDPEQQDFARLVELHYKGLYRFAFTLTRQESESCDLVQQTFYLWATHGRELRDPRKVKSWLFTTLYREFLRARRRQDRFPHQSLDETDAELLPVSPQAVSQLDWRTVIEALGRVDEAFQAPLVLFYLEDHSYQEIAEALQIPMGTVMSRISRGRAQLQELLLKQRADGKVIRFPDNTERRRRE